MGGSVDHGFAGCQEPRPRWRSSLGKSNSLSLTWTADGATVDTTLIPGRSCITHISTDRAGGWLAYQTSRRLAAGTAVGSNVIVLRNMGSGVETVVSADSEDVGR